MLESLHIIRIFLKALKNDRRGVTAVEYTVIAALIIGAVAAAFTTLAGDMTTKLTNIAAQI